MRSLRDNIDALTGLRATAALMIVLGHTIGFFNYPWLIVCVPGMTIFFTLSGFIIHHVYAETFSSGWAPATRSFAVARISRLYPLYIILFIFNLTMEPMASTLISKDNLIYLVAYLTGTWTWWPTIIDGQPIFEWQYGISWSISTELFFYVIYALVLYRAINIKSLKKSIMLLLGFCLFSVLFFYIVMITRDIWEAFGLRFFPQFTARNANFTNSFYRWALYISPYSRVFEFAGGVLACQVFRLLRQRGIATTRLTLEFLTVSGLLLLLSSVGLLYYYAYHSAWLAAGNMSFGALVVNLHMNFLFAPACYVLIISLALGSSVIGRLLGSRPAVFAGDVSYSTYLSHQYAEELVGLAGVPFTVAVVLLAAALPTVYLLSWMLYSVVEVPGKRFLRQALQPRPAVVAAGLEASTVEAGTKSVPNT